MNNVLVINAGSSSLKYQLIDTEREFTLAKGVCERIGIDGAIKQTTHDGRQKAANMDFPTHKQAFEALIQMLTAGENSVVSSINEIAAVGHRVAQGGEQYRESIRINDSVLWGIEKLAALAPLHNPANVMGIRACLELFGTTVPQVAVFDTSFHATLPPVAYLYPIPYELYEKYSIRRYGFHGTSHRYVSARLAELMGRPLTEMKVVTCHLGNGSSMAAIQYGISIDTTMGFTPLEGLEMGTRSGTIDPSIVTYLQEKEQLAPDQVNDLLNKQSGLLGVSGLSSDLRDLSDAAKAGNERAKLALDILHYQIKKQIGAYAAAMDGLDAVVFTGGIGENSGLTRAAVLEPLHFLGIAFDRELNEVGNGTECEITTNDSPIKVYIIPTNEELLIARDTAAVLTGYTTEHQEEGICVI